MKLSWTARLVVAGVLAVALAGAQVDAASQDIVGAVAFRRADAAGSVTLVGRGIDADQLSALLAARVVKLDSGGSASAWW